MIVYRGKRNYEKDFIIELSTKSTSKREMLIGMDLPLGGTYGYRVLNYFIEIYDVDVSHFEGREKAARTAARNAIPLKDILEGKHPQYACFALKLRMIKEGLLVHRCDECKLAEWRGRPIPIDIEHINGKPWDHRRENLRLLCRNCHAQTDTFCGRNKTKRTSETKELVQSNATKERDTHWQRSQDAYVSIVLSSGIDFSAMGWVTAIAPLIKQKPQKVNVWMKKYMPEFYATCWKRKSRK